MSITFLKANENIVRCVNACVHGSCEHGACICEVRICVRYICLQFEEDLFLSLT